MNLQPRLYRAAPSPSAEWAYALGLVLTGLALAVVSPVVAAAQTTTRSSVSTGGGQAGGDSGGAAVDADGRYVAFQSWANDLVAGDTNGVWDVFVHDRVTNATARVSVGPGGAQATGGRTGSVSPAISADGRYVAFESDATNLVAGDTNNYPDIFVHDRTAGATTRVSVASGGVQAFGLSLRPTISADGRFVAFESSAADLVADDTGSNMDVFVHDRVAGTTSRVNLGPGAVEAVGGFSSSPSFSADGRFVAFESAATNLVSGDTNGASDVFLRDRLTSVTTRVSVADGGVQGVGGSFYSGISGDGRYVVFSSNAANLVPGDTNGIIDVFVHDRFASTTRQVSLATDGSQAIALGGSGSYLPIISADGRFVAFTSDATNLVTGDTNAIDDTFVRDLTMGMTTRVSINSAGVQASGASSSFGEAITANGRYVVFTSDGVNLVPGDTNDAWDVFVHDLDADADGLLASWETAFGLDPLVGTGDDGGSGDPDGDGRSNGEEYAAGTHPRGLYTRYLAEGATSAFFNARLAVLNAAGIAHVLLRFQKSDGTSAARVLGFNGLARTTVDAKTVPGLAAAEFSTVIEADNPVVVDRQMTWDASGYGSHAETAIAAPSPAWYLAEGATHNNFQLFYLVQNPNPTSVAVTVTYLRPPPAAVVTKVYSVPAQSRFNIWVNAEAANDPALSGLAATDVSAVLTAPQPILVERAMYLSRPGVDGQFGTPDDVVFNAGHESAGVPAPAVSWFLAEGATGPYFDEFLLVANPNLTAAQVEVRYLLTDGTVLTKSYVIEPQSRFTIWVNEESFSGTGTALADAALSATVTSTNGAPIIVERAMWWPRPAPFWMEAHNSPGTTATGTVWGLAEGEVGGASAAETYILIANTSAVAGTVRVTVVLEGGGLVTRDVALPANSRTNVPVVEGWFPGVSGKRFGAIVESLGSTPAQIVVERAMYSDAAGVHWAAGTNATATRLTP